MYFAVAENAYKACAVIIGVIFMTSRHNGLVESGIQKLNYKAPGHIKSDHIDYSPRNKSLYGTACWYLAKQAEHIQVKR